MVTPAPASALATPAPASALAPTGADASDAAASSPPAQPPRRLRRKVPRPAALPPPAPAPAPDAALDPCLVAVLSVDCDDDDLAALAQTVRRKYVHWVHVRTHDPTHVQPSAFTAQGWYEHLEKCYREAYPQEDSESGSILAFGMVATEEHKASALEKHRALHRHGATASSCQHMWSKVAKISREKYNVYISAVSHDTYASMFAYLRRPTKKKPLHELDHTPFFSKHHPSGEKLATLLKAGASFAAAYEARGGGAGAAGVGSGKRERLPNLYQLVRTHDLRSVVAFRAHAAAEDTAGRGALAEYCTRQGRKLQELLDNAWAVADAPRELASAANTLLDKLRHAAEDLPCLCGGSWIRGVTQILELNGFSVQGFCIAVCRALHFGAKRGAHIALVGPAGCGKSTLVEALELIFRTAEKPERGSSFPLGSIPSSDIILWQDYEHDEGTVAFSDLLSLLVGESVGIRNPGVLNKKERSACPCFVSGRTPIRSGRRDPVAARKLDDMMDERFTFFKFTQPIPMQLRRVDWVHCGRCCATLYSQASTNPLVTQGELLCPTVYELAVPQAAGPSGQQVPSCLPEALSTVVDLHNAGFLDVDEFRTVKCLILRGLSPYMDQRLAALAALRRDGGLDAAEFHAAKRQMMMPGG